MQRRAKYFVTYVCHLKYLPKGGDLVIYRTIVQRLSLSNDTNSVKYVSDILLDKFRSVAAESSFIFESCYKIYDQLISLFEVMRQIYPMHHTTRSLDAMTRQTLTTPPKLVKTTADDFLGISKHNDNEIRKSLVHKQTLKVLTFVVDPKIILRQPDVAEFVLGTPCSR